MSARNKFAWITAAVDDETALQTIVLAKSLKRVVTIANTVALISEDVTDRLGKILTQYFDDVIAITLGSCQSKLQKMELLITHAWNVPVYEKCAVLYSNKMILKNCDELFDTNETFLAASTMKDGKQLIDPSVMIITPGFDEYKAINNLIKMTSHECLSDVLYDHFCYTKIEELQNNYNFNVTNNYTKKTYGLDIKILYGFDTLDSDAKLDEIPNTFQEVYSSWKIWQTEICSEVNIFTTELAGTEEIGTNKITLAKKDYGYYKDAIAIVGHSCRFPGANSNSEFWELIQNGRDEIRSVPLERLFDFQLNDSRFTESKAGFLKCPIDEFDAKFFGISPREAAFMDPQQRLLMEVAWEALEHAAINPQSLKGSNTGVFTGVWTHDYERLVTEASTAQDFHHVILGNAFSATSARVSHFLGLNGPNVATESGCSSSMVALHLACDSLRKRESDLGMVLGANVIILQLPLGEIPILAKDGRCKTFDESADGFGRAEGVAVIILKRLPDAIKDGDRILGIIRGSAISNEGTSSSFGTPSKMCQEIAIKDALNNSGVHPGDVDYVEAHGTGTPIGDPIEFAAISAGYAGKRNKPLFIGSVKTNIGHTESAAGLAGLIKVIMALGHEMIPPHKNFTKLNPNIDLNVVPAVIPLVPQQWSRNSDRIRIAGISSFGISGTNVHVILEEPPSEEVTKSLEIGLESEKTFHILTLSAKSENALKDLTNIYVKYLGNNPELNIGDLAYTCNNGRAHLKYRLAVTGKSVEDFQKAFEIDAYIPPDLDAKPKIAFLFTGQGSQYWGMAKSLFLSNSDFRQSFDKCDNIIQKNTGISLRNAIWGDSDFGLLDQTIYSQLSIFAVECSLLKLWESVGIVPDVVLGHSVGEYVAAVAAGIMSMDDALNLLVERSRLIQTLPPGGMMAVSLSKKKVSQFISEFSSDKSMWLDIAVINSNEEVVVAGRTDSIENFKTFCTKNGTKFQHLAASHAFHSRDMENLAITFGDFAKKIVYKPPKCRYVSGTMGLVISDDEMVKGDYWVNHAKEPVNFQKAMTTIGDLDCNVFVEIGAHPVLLALGMTNINCSEGNLWLPSIRRNKDDWEIFLNSLRILYSNGVDVNWAPLDNCWHRKKLPLPTYPFQREKYWTDISGNSLNTIIHPLLGRQVILADVADIVYEHTWDLGQLQYLKDHQVAHVTVLPAAGFLEIILAAGQDIMLKVKNVELGVLEVKDFVVESPLELEERTKYKIQVVVSPVENDTNIFYVKFYIFKKLNGFSNEKDWKQFSSAFVSLHESVSWSLSTEMNSADMSSEKNHSTLQYISESVALIKNRCSTERESSEFYKFAPEIGLHFGEAFKSIEKVWVGDHEAIALIPAPKKAGNLVDYRCHPIVLDAMIQLFGLSIGNSNVELHLPIGIDHVFMVNHAVCDNFFAHAKWSEEKSAGSVALYSDKNVLMVVIVGIRLIRTSVSSFLNVISAQKNILPGMYQEVWRQRLGSLQARIDIGKIEETENIIFPLLRSMEQDFKLINFENHNVLHKCVCQALMKIMMIHGFYPKVGHTYWIEEFLQYHLISNAYLMFMKRIFEIFCEEGFGIEIDNGSGFMDGWKCLKTFPTIEEIESEEKHLQKYFLDVLPLGQTVVPQILKEFIYKLLWEVLTEQKTPVSALFGNNQFNVLDIYTKSDDYIVSSRRVSRYLGLALQYFKSDGKQEDSIVRIIEIGAGSGATTKEILNVLQKENIPYRYTFTDISSHFIESAKQQFSAVGGIEYNVLDIENDPSRQGFCPYNYDVVVAVNVVHATQNLKTSLINIRKLLRTGGILVLGEMTKPWRPIDVLFGTLEGYWKFIDYDIRFRHPIVSALVWSKLILQTGFENAVNVCATDEIFEVLISKAVDIKYFDRSINGQNLVQNLNDSNEKKSAWIVLDVVGDSLVEIREKFRHTCDEVIFVKRENNEMEDATLNTFCWKLNDDNTLKNMISNNEKYSIEGIIYMAISINSENQDIMYESFLKLCKLFAEEANNLQIILVTKGVYFIQNQKLVLPFNAVVNGMAKSLANEVAKFRGKIVDLDPDEFNPDIESQQIFFEAFDNEEHLVCYRNKKRFASRMVTLPKPLAPLIFPHGRYRIEIPKSKNINDLKFSALQKEPLNTKDMEILVKAVALNFRDILVILKPEQYFTVKETVGSDFAGVVSNVGSAVTKFTIGDEIYGVAVCSAVGSHAITHEDLCMRKPKDITFSEASTIPSVLLTALLFGSRCRFKKGGNYFDSRCVRRSRFSCN